MRIYRLCCTAASVDSSDTKYRVAGLGITLAQLINIVLLPKDVVALFMRIAGMFRTLFESVLATVARDRVRHQTIRELQGLNDHLLADIGILRSEIPEFADSLIEANEMPRRELLGRTGPSTRVPAPLNPELATLA